MSKLIIQAPVNLGDNIIFNSGPIPDNVGLMDRPFQEGLILNNNTFNTDTYMTTPDDVTVTGPLTFNNGAKLIFVNQNAIEVNSSATLTLTTHNPLTSVVINSGHLTLNDVTLQHGSNARTTYDLVLGANATIINSSDVYDNINNIRSVDMDKGSKIDITSHIEYYNTHMIYLIKCDQDRLVLNNVTKLIETIDIIRQDLNVYSYYKSFPLDHYKYLLAYDDHPHKAIIQKIWKDIELDHNKLDHNIVDHYIADNALLLMGVSVDVTESSLDVLPAEIISLVGEFVTGSD